MLTVSASARRLLTHRPSHCAAQTFKGWADKKAQAKRDAESEKEAARRKKGVLTGREIFAEVRCRQVFGCLRPYLT